MASGGLCFSTDSMSLEDGWHKFMIVQLMSPDTSCKAKQVTNDTSLQHAQRSANEI